MSEEISMPNSATPLRILQISDLHLKTQPGSRVWGVDVDASLDAVLACARERHPTVDFILITGDLVGDEPDAYPRVRQALEPFGVPVYCLPGNHDFPAAMGQHLRKGRVQWQRYVSVGDWQVVLLNSSSPGAPDGYLASSELALLDTVLATSSKHTLVCLHHNPLSVGTPWLDTMMVTNGKALFTVLDRYSQVRAVVWGHIHAEFSARRGDLHLLATPATCVQLKPGTAEPQVDEQPPGYRWFELYPDGRLETGVERVDPARYASS